jgi:coatomer protein complex subunit gamma
LHLNVAVVTVSWWCQAAPDIVRRWVNEIQTVMTTKSDMVQYHALALMKTIKQNDKLAISKVLVHPHTPRAFRFLCHLPARGRAWLTCRPASPFVLSCRQLVSQLMKTSMRSPLATCLLIRYTADLLKSDIDATAARAAYEFLESCMRHKSEMVIYEAAKAVCDLPGVVAKSVSLFPGYGAMQPCVLRLVCCV